jgi:hypothetical protein
MRSKYSRSIRGKRVIKGKKLFTLIFKISVPFCEKLAILTDVQPCLHRERGFRVFMAGHLTNSFIEAAYLVVGGLFVFKTEKN